MNDDEVELPQVLRQPGVGARAAAAVTVGALALVPDRRWPTPLRLAKRVASAGLCAGGAWFAGGRVFGPEVDHRHLIRSGATAGFAGIGWGAAALDDRMDTAIEAGLVRLGVPRPRWVMAVAAAVLTYGAGWGEAPALEPTEPAAPTGPGDGGGGGAGQA